MARQLNLNDRIKVLKFAVICEGNCHAARRMFYRECIKEGRFDDRTSIERANIPCKTTFKKILDTFNEVGRVDLEVKKHRKRQKTVRTAKNIARVQAEIGALKLKESILCT